jgi:membrane protease YdiL (CAAX protease family)
MRLVQQKFAIANNGRLPRVPVAIAICGVLLLPLILALSAYEWKRLVMLILVAPVLEEIVFRAGLHEALQRQWRQIPHLANAATALIFGASHMLVRGDPAAFAVVLPALLIGAVYERTGRLRHCILLHAAMNVGWLAWQSARASLPFL